MYCRESNPVRLASQLSRSVRLFRAACRNYRENPNKATRQRRMDRGLAVVSVRAKYRYVLACCQGADFSTAHALGQRYQDANARWTGNYVTNHAL